jgi:hypothetical protein
MTDRECVSNLENSMAMGEVKSSYLQGNFIFLEGLQGRGLMEKFWE